MKNFLANFSLRKVSIFVTIVVSFTYNVLLDRDVSCTCKPGDSDCDIYMALPFFIILLLILWTDKKFFWSCRYMCPCRGAASCCRCQFCGIFFFRIFKAVLVGLLWVVSVLIDGDWYVCRQNDYTAHPQLPCKTNITAEEQVIIAELKNTSRSIGFGVILGILFVATVIQLIHTALPSWKRCSDKRILYDELIAEEEEIVLDNFLRSKAKDELRENIKRTFEAGQLKECFHVAEELIDRTGSPGQNSAAADQPTSLRTSTSTFSTTVEENRTPQNPAEPNEPGPSGIQRESSRESIQPTPEDEENRTAQNPAEPNEPGPSGIQRESSRESIHPTPDDEDDLSIFGTPEEERKPLVHP